MAFVYERVNGRKLEKVIAQHETVQLRLDTLALEYAIRAESILAGHRHDGHAEIIVEQGHVDTWVTLSDDRGESAALSIEYGREPSYSELEDGSVAADGGMEGLFILHQAFAMKPKKGVRR